MALPSWWIRRTGPLLRIVTCVLLPGSPIAIFAQSADTLERMGLASKATLEREIMVPMRDGVRLSTAVIRPSNVRGPMPVILIRTPYDKNGELEDKILATLVLRGYAIVVQNERGTEWSEGKYHFLPRSREDGYDTISWIVQQPWSNGKVGTFGCSSSAEHQLGLSSMNHPAHKAMVAMGPGSAIGDFPGVHTMGGFYKGGVPNLEWEGWYRWFGQTNRPKLPTDISQEERVRLADWYSPFLALTPEMRKKVKEQAMQSREDLPSQDILRRVNVPETDFDWMITASPADPRWRKIGFIRDGDHPRVPALYVDAWYDYSSFGTVKLFEYLQDTPNIYLIVAPTAHCSMRDATQETMVGGRSVGDARYDYDGLILKWFDHWLRDESNDVLNRPKVQMYLMGANVWKTYPSWPVPGAKQTKLFLHSDGHANTRLGTGGLSDVLPAAESADSFVSDPLYPVPYYGGADDTPIVADQGNVEMRSDVLVYSTEVLKEGVDVTGEVKGEFYVSSTTPDADLALKLVDVYPDGKAFNLYDTMLRLRYREGFDKPTFMKPGEVYRAEVTGIVTSNYFGPGHRIRIEIAGSNSHFERNLQTGGKNYDETKPVVATIQIHHSTDEPSHIDLPVVGR